MKTTLLLLLLPMTALCQAPPCLTGVSLWTEYDFGIAFPDNGCQYVTSWMDEPIDCHGAINRYPQFQRLAVLNDTTYTITAATFPLTPTGAQPDLSALVFSFWTGCPYTDGELVASVECGGWDCIEWGEIGFIATLTLEAGVYWFWPGMYSDGVNCNFGIVQGSVMLGGECDTPPPAPTLPCPAYTVEFSGQTIAYCGEQSEPIDTGLPCSPNTNYATVQFTTQGGSYPIHVWSDYNYVDFPNSPTNYADIAIFTECDGDLVYYSGGGACAFGSGVAPPAPNSVEYTLNLNLPAGTYIAVIGYWAAVGNPYESEGCIEYTFGAIGFLELPPTDQETDQVTDQAAPMYRRYTKVVIEGRGLFIRDGYTGELYDFITRKILE